MSGGGHEIFLGRDWLEGTRSTYFRISSINSSTIVLSTLLVTDGDKLLGLNTRSRGDGLQT